MPDIVEADLSQAVLFDQGLKGVRNRGRLVEISHPSDDEREDYTDSAGTVHKKPVLISYNPKYAPRVVGRSSSFKICGRVLN